MLVPKLRSDLIPLEGAGRVPISSQRVPPNPATTPRIIKRQGKKVTPRSSDPGLRGRNECNGRKKTCPVRPLRWCSGRPVGVTSPPSPTITASAGKGCIRTSAKLVFPETSPAGPALQRSQHLPDSRFRAAEVRTHRILDCFVFRQSATGIAAFHASEADTTFLRNKVSHPAWYRCSEPGSHARSQSPTDASAAGRALTSRQRKPPTFPTPADIRLPAWRF